MREDHFFIPVKPVAYNILHIIYMLHIYIVRDKANAEKCVGENLTSLIDVKNYLKVRIFMLEKI